jgi:hypothetical protein
MHDDENDDGNNDERAFQAMLRSRAGPARVDAGCGIARTRAESARARTRPAGTGFNLKRKRVEKKVAGR